MVGRPLLNHRPNFEFLANFEGEIPICLNVQFSSPRLRRRVKFVTNLAHERNQLIEIHRFCKTFWESSKHGICILLCLWLRSRSSGSLVKLVNIWFHQKEQMVEKYLHVLDFRFNSKLIEDDSHRSLLSQAQGLSNIGNLRRQSIYLQWIRHTENSLQVGSIIMTKIKGAKITDQSGQKCAKSC